MTASSSIREAIRRFFTPVQPLPAGIYHYQAPPDEPENYRLHLRLEPDGHGILVINASTILHLNQTAAEYAYHLVKRTPLDQVAATIARRYRVNQQQARLDYLDLQDRIDTLIHTPDLDPETFLDFERTSPDASQLSAPFRLDCAITYQLPEGAAKDAAPIWNVDRELDSTTWKIIIDQAWSAGVPQILFTGGEPTLRADLPDLIAYAESKGQVTGLLTDGLRLADYAYLQTLLQTGLDHVMIIFQPENDHSWQALQLALAEDLFVAVHLTLTEKNHDQVPGLIQKLAEDGVKAISLSTSNSSLSAALTAARDLVAALGINLVWNLPVPYSTLHPVALELAGFGRADEPAPASGRSWLYVEPDGDVLVAQGVTGVLGNLTRDRLEVIWQAAQSAR